MRHFGYSWSPGSTLKEMGTLSARRLAQKASQMARCTALYTTSRPVNATKAMGRQHSSGGSSHWDPAIVMVQQQIDLHKRAESNTLLPQAYRSSVMLLTVLASPELMSLKYILTKINTFCTIGTIQRAAEDEQALLTCRSQDFSTEFK